jgi:hypothetical protein
MEAKRTTAFVLFVSESPWSLIGRTTVPMNLSALVAPGLFPVVPS